MTTNTERGREVRRRLAAAALDLVAERGWAGVSTRVLAERAGVVPGVVHYHFPSVQALLSEATVAAMRTMVDEFGQMLDRAGTPEELLDLILQGMERFSGSDRASAVFIETYLTATRDDALREAVGDVLQVFRARLTRWLTEHRMATPEETASVLAAALDGVLLHRGLDPAFTARTVVPVLRRILLPADETSPGSRRARKR